MCVWYYRSSSEINLIGAWIPGSALPVSGLFNIMTCLETEGEYLMNKRNLIYSVVLFLSVLPFAVTALEEAEQKFNLLDNDGDGYISRSEATADYMLRERWNEIDKDKDGKLTTKEFAVYANVPDEPLPEE